MQSPPPGPETRPQDRPLPDLSAIDVELLRTGGAHPVLRAVLADLLAYWPAPEDAAAYHDDDVSARRTHPRF